MSPLRLLLVTRWFWPLTGRAESIMASLATEFRRQGAEPTILCARWQNDWPAEIVYRGVRVVRLPNPTVRGWGTFRYLLALSRWLRSHAGQFDLVYVSLLRHDACTVLKTRGRGGWPVVLRTEWTGERGDCAWQRQVPFGRRIARLCATADAVIAPSAAVADELLAADYPADRVHLVPNGAAIPSRPVDDHAREAARSALAEANEELALPAGARLAVHIGRLLSSKGLDRLVTAWQTVATRHQDAWLWLIGEGPLEDALATQIKQAGLAQRVIFGGVFDDVDDVLRAADLFVLPGHHDGPSLSLMEAIAAGLPIVAADAPATRGLVEPGRHGLLVPPDDPAALAAAIDALLDDPQRAAALAAAGRERVAGQNSLGKMAHDHLQLFERLVAERHQAAPKPA